jgi:hypothetical protein
MINATVLDFMTKKKSLKELVEELEKMPFLFQEVKKINENEKSKMKNEKIKIKI